MSDLLKPNDNGLASLDEVRAWMEAQSQKEDATPTTTSEPPLPACFQFTYDFSYGKYSTYPGEIHPIQEWKSILKERNVCPITLGEIYRLAMIRNDTDNTKKAFHYITKELLWGAILTGTSYDHHTSMIYNGIQDEHVSLPKEDVGFGLQGDAKARMQEFLQALFMTVDPIEKIQKNLESIARGKTTLRLSRLNERKYADITNGTPFTIHTEWHSADDAYITIGLVENSETSYLTIGVEHD